MVIIIKWGKIKTESKAADDDASDSWKGGFHMSGKKQIGLGIAALAAGAGIAAVAAQGRKTSAVSREAKKKNEKEERSDLRGCSGKPSVYHERVPFHQQGQDRELSV